jgi:xylulokinase
MSKEPIIISLDLGTSHCKSIATNSKGQILASSDHPVITYRPRPGWFEQDPIQWIDAISVVLRSVTSQLGDLACQVEALGLSSHGPSMVLVDQNLNPLTNSIIWQDQRSASHAKRLVNDVGPEWVGKGLVESSFPAKIYWSQENQPEVFNQARYILGTKGFLTAVLTGKVVDEPSSCCTPYGRWPEDLFAYLGISLNQLSEIIPSQDNAGPLRPEFAKEVNLPIGTKVVMGLTDGAAACLGSGLHQVGQGIVSLSTNGVFRSVVPECLPGKDLYQHSMFCYPYIDQTYITGGYTCCGGDSLSWFLETVKHDHEITQALYNEFTLAASKSPVGAGGITFLPYLIGRGTPHSSEIPAGAFLNLARHHTSGDLFRAVLEGVSYSLRDIFQFFEENFWKVTDIRLTGGGASNFLWRQILADVFARPLRWMTTDSLLGVTVLVWTALGAYPSIEEAISVLLPPGEEVIPSLESPNKYEEFYKVFQSYSQKLLPESKTIRPHL